MENNELHKKDFELHYKNNAIRPERVTPIRKAYKTKVYMTPEKFEEVKRIYARLGHCMASIQEVMSSLNLSRGSAEKYLDEARKMLVGREDELKKEQILIARVSELEAQLAKERSISATANERYMKEFQTTQTKHSNQIDQYQSKLNELTLQNTRLQAKVEVMSDLLKSKF